jgi:hypothetical protein
MPSGEELRAMVASLEAPVRDAFPWAYDYEHDSRPFGPGFWLPVMAALYFLSLTVLKQFAAGAGWLQKPLKYFLLINNVLMALYSAWVTVAVAATVRANLSEGERTAAQLFCDPERKLLSGLDMQMYIFYLSKYWEWWDTYALVLKGKGVWPPANPQFFLHIFHHTTTATVGWLAWRQELSVAWLGPLTNGFVHTLMYAYYALVTLFPSMSRFGLYITPVQLLQFVICIVAMLYEAFDSLVFSGASCGMTKRAALWMAFTYSSYLYMFWNMYGAKKSARNEDRAKTK